MNRHLQKHHLIRRGNKTQSSTNMLEPTKIENWKFWFQFTKTEIKIRNFFNDENWIEIPHNYPAWTEMETEIGIFRNNNYTVI